MKLAVRPLIAEMYKGQRMERLQQSIVDMEASWHHEEEMRKKFEEQNAKMQQEIADMLALLQQERDNLSSASERAEKLLSAKGDLENELSVRKIFYSTFIKLFNNFDYNN